MATVTRGPRQGSTRAWCPLIKSQLYMCTGRREQVFVFTGGAGERWSSGMQDATVPYTVWCQNRRVKASLNFWSRLLFPATLPFGFPSGSTLTTSWAVPPTPILTVLHAYAQKLIFQLTSRGIMPSRFARLRAVSDEYCARRSALIFW